MKCSVPGCSNDKNSNETLSYFKFPSDKTLQQKWLEVINRPSFVPKKNHMVCEDHFQKDEVIHLFTRKQLVKNAIPTLNLPPGNRSDGMQMKMEDAITAESIANYNREESCSKASGTRSNNTITNYASTTCSYPLNNQKDKINNYDAEVNNKEAETSTIDYNMTCAVPHCYNTRKTKIAGLSFYDFPEEPSMKRKWLDAIGRRFGDLVVKKGSFVCSNHFIVQHLHVLKPPNYALKSSQTVKNSTPIMQKVTNEDYIEYNSSNIELNDPLETESYIDNEEVDSTNINEGIGYESTIALEIEPTVGGFDVEDETPANIIKVDETGDNLNCSVTKVSKTTNEISKTIESSIKEFGINHNYVLENVANEIVDSIEAFPIYSASGEKIGVYLPPKGNVKQQPRLRVRKLPREKPLEKPMDSDKQTDTTVTTTIPMDEVFELRIPESWETVEVKDIDELHCENYESTLEPEQSYQNISNVPPFLDKRISLQACLQSSDEEENDDSLLPHQYVNLKQKLRVLRKFLDKRKAQIKISQQKLRKNQKQFIKCTKKRNELKADNEKLRKELRHDNKSDTVQYKLPSWVK